MHTLVIFITSKLYTTPAILAFRMPKHEFRNYEASLGYQVRIETLTLWLKKTMKSTTDDDRRCLASVGNCVCHKHPKAPESQ